MTTRIACEIDCQNAKNGREIESATKGTFYITTPLYYPSGNWHLGHSYTTVCCDAIARFKRMSGFDVFYLTGTDDHGQKIHERATLSGKTPAEFTRELREGIMDIWKRLDISYDKFISTTYDYHVEAVQRIFTKLYEKDEIYKSVYRGKYCTPCEAFWTQPQLNDGKCPDCGREVIDFEEECYFFRLSKYTDRLKKLLTETDFLSPKSRVNEMVGNFLDAGLTDLAVSRSTVEWGISVPFDPKHTIYVWIDALSNYITALGYGSDDTTLFDKFWQADLHMVGKEIVRFHTIIWPALLMALDLPMPKKVYGHGWLLLGGDKMSKSKGNVADPNMLIDRYGVDAVRYYLLREVPFGADGVYSLESFLTRYNSDLVNDLGNLVKRTLAMTNQYFGGKVSSSGEAGEFDAEFIQSITALPAEVNAHMDKITCSKALESIMSVVSRANKYIDETKPWVLAKSPDQKSRLEAVLYNLLECIRVTASLLSPFLTEKIGMIFDGLGVTKPTDFSQLSFGAVASYQITEQPVLYQRVDIKKELAQIEGAQSTDTISQKSAKASDQKSGEKSAQSAKASDQKSGEKGAQSAKAISQNTDEKDGQPAKKAEITIDEFDKCELRVADVIECERVEKADKLLKLRVRIGDEERTIVSGIAKSYAPDELIGKQVVVVTNLKPVKLRGILSQGMVLCADNGDGVKVVSPDSPVKSGGTVC